MKKYKILVFGYYQLALQILRCDHYSQKYLLRKFNKCFMKTLHYVEFENTEDLLVKRSKTKKERSVTKYKKGPTSMKTRNLIIQLQIDVQKLFQHEVFVNIKL